MNLNYKQKYLKYKLKYLTTKKMYGGSPAPNSTPPAPNSTPPARNSTPNSTPPAPTSTPSARNSTPPAPTSTPSARNSTPPAPTSTPPAPTLHPASPHSSHLEFLEESTLDSHQIGLSNRAISVSEPHILVLGSPQIGLSNRAISGSYPHILVKAEIYLNNHPDNQSPPHDKPIFEKLTFGQEESITITLNTQHRPEPAGTYAEQIALHWNNNLASWNQEATRLKLHEQTLNVSPAELEEKKISTENIKNIYIMNVKNEQISNQNINNQIPDYDLLQRNYLKIHINKNIF